jgi:ceramide glucosyltransferase
MNSAQWLFEGFLVLLPLCGCAYYLLCLWGARQFLRRRVVANTAFVPPISILKPLKGMDPEIYSSLRSHCVQEYPEYEIIFGVSDADDPALAWVEQLRREFPEHAIQLVICAKILGGNVKVSNLVQMLPHARHQHLLINDSDIRVEPDYLRRVIAPLCENKVGLVTCLYRGVAGETLASRIEALGISTDFCGGALAAIQMEGGPHFGLGSTLVLRSADLQSIGGFEALVDYLADDYQLAQRLSQKGLDVYLSEVVVETFLPPYTWRSFFDHQLRWSRNVRDLRGWSYLGAGVTFGVPWALLGLASARGAWWAWSILGLTLALRMLMAWLVGVLVAKDWQALRSFWLIPLRDVAALVIWVAGFFGATVVWRGDRFRLHDGKLTKIAAA